MKAVFDTMPNSGYSDDLARHYNFPQRYLEIVVRCVGDWVVFRRPRANQGSMAYIGVGRVISVEPDLKTPSRHFAVLEEYVPFAEPVPWRPSGRYFEGRLRDIEPTSGVGLYLRG